MWILAAAAQLGERVSALEATVRSLEGRVDSIDYKFWSILLLLVTQLIAHIVTLKRNDKRGEHHG